MNHHGLVKLYDRLTARERLPLILAASARGDASERQRLIDSAPRVTYRVPEHFGRACALREISDHQFMELLDGAARYFQGMGMLERGTDAADDDRLDYVLLLGFQFKTLLAGWRQFCAEEGFPAEALWEPLPGYATMRSAEDLAKTIAFVPEGVEAFLRRRGIGRSADASVVEAQIITADSVARELHRCLESRADWWG